MIKATYQGCEVEVVRTGRLNTRVRLEGGSTRLVPTSSLVFIGGHVRPIQFTVGVEIEFVGRQDCLNAFNQAMTNKFGSRYRYSGRYGQSSVTAWVLGRDGSVHGTGANANQYMSCELTSPILRSERDFEDLKEVYRLIRTVFHGKVNSTCGGHIHLGSFSSERCSSVASKILRTYSRVEGALDRLVSPSRNNNRYCSSLVGRNPDSLVREKYYKMSTRNFCSNGTVEVRHHQGTLNYSKIRNWILLCEKLVERAVRSDELVPVCSTFAELARALNLPEGVKNFYTRRVSAVA